MGCQNAPDGFRKASEGFRRLPEGFVFSNTRIPIAGMAQVRISYMSYLEARLELILVLHVSLFKFRCSVGVCNTGNAMAGVAQQNLSLQEAQEVQGSFTPLQ